MLELLLSQGGEVDLLDCKFRTPLAVAVLRNNQEAVSLLVRYNAPIYNYIYELEIPAYSRRILQDALQNGNRKIVEHLLWSGTVPNEICNSFPWSFQSDVVPKMLSLFLDDLKNLRSSPLENDFVKMCDAIFNKNFAMMCNLFHKGETITLFSGIHSESNKKCVKMLLANFHENSLSFSSLHFAAVCDFKKAAKLLLLYGATLFQKDAIGRTSLHLAQSSEMVEILLNTKHKPIETSNLSFSTLKYCSTFEFVPSAISTLGHPQGIVNVKDNFGNTPLHSITMSATDVPNCLTILEKMIQQGANPCICCKRGYLPLDHFRTISLFLKESDVDRGERILGCSRTFF
ncbi:serine/threonine-protein phosphatase 6 regulatory ankyrin repeat subunit A-like [Saccostrea echinata]|uniref:serine/threonine-protein phosphatase 6 regulatory ankyrin repeat subunit A-like n=1 Tax=Saccostrea echinata TaxID=191078 RepID=UPI002A81904B|nr:serine/threonine-protein phosphatase 6 regulatory ankyrin repeat subunit A-like [Saccostrea echinata]